VTFPASPTTSIALTNGGGVTTNSAHPAAIKRTRDLALRVAAGRPYPLSPSSRDARLRALILRNEAGRR
jgi:hypothetical protein